MREAREVIHQGCLGRGGWVGYPDFLVRVDDLPSDLGDWSYEVHDAKMGSEPKPDHVFQLLFYTDELERLQGVRSRRMHLILGSGERPWFDPDDFSAYAARVRARSSKLATRSSPARRPIRPTRTRPPPASSARGGTSARTGAARTTTSRSSRTCSAGRGSSSKPSVSGTSAPSRS